MLNISNEWIGILLFFCFGLFAALLFVNLYFRMKVLKAYRKLVSRNVEFEARHVFQKQKLESDILPRYPESRNEILDFVNNLRFSIRMATVLVTVITAIGAILMFTR